MAILDNQSFMLPFLNILGDRNEHKMSEIIGRVALQSNRRG